MDLVPIRARDIDNTMGDNNNNEDATVVTFPATIYVLLISFLSLM
jgi:hypothetical protein